ncbi:MAG: DUF3300 domain-containing protein [Gammaproteobacteria bacterium]|nr:DUF3300 domain-containing protein [Gammaproteobacteria bacterium]
MKGPIESNRTTITLVSVLMLLLALPATAQVPVDEDGNPLGSYELQDSGKPAGDNGNDEIAPLSGAELEDLVGPVALYPDDLLAIVLPASTYPLEIVQAARFLEQLEMNSSLEPDEAWDDSIVALLNYPDVIRMMDEDIDWTWRLGEAVINQQNDVIAAVESFRDRAYAAGNLKTDEHQKVAYDDEGVLEIVPVSEELIYVPYYEPEEVVVYQPRRVYYYYPDPYPVYYYPYPTGYRFRSGYFWGVTTAFSIGWSNHYLHVYHPSYWGHPYYGRYYYGHYYRRPSITIYNNWYVNNSYRTPRYRYRDGDYWRPRNRAGSEPRVRNYHYAPNGSRNSRDYTVTRNDRLRVGDDGRMDLRLRERDSRRTTSVGNARNTRSITGGNAASDRTSSSTSRNRSENRDATNNRTRTSTTGSRTNSRREITSSTNNDLRFRDRTSAVRNPSETRSNSNNRGDRTATTTNRTVTSRRDTSARVAAPPRVSQPTNRQATPNRATTSRRSSTDRVSAPPRTTAPRATTAPRSSAPRSSAPRTAPTPRSSAPRAAPPPRSSAPRSTAPAVQPRAPAAPRSNSSSSRRSSSSAGPSRRSTASRPRVRNNQD